jgi:hypothetical protein
MQKKFTHVGALQGDRKLDLIYLFSPFFPGDIIGQRTIFEGGILFSGVLSLIDQGLF